MDSSELDLGSLGPQKSAPPRSRNVITWLRKWNGYSYEFHFSSPCSTCSA